MSVKAIIAAAVALITILVGTIVRHRSKKRGTVGS